MLLPLNPHICPQVRGLRRPITLEELKSHKGGPLSSMALFTTARLSVQPVSRQEWDFVLGLELQEP
jgi:predicted RNA-binding protein with PUA-like domain